MGLALDIKAVTDDIRQGMGYCLMELGLALIDFQNVHSAPLFN
jgi:hypothetical protein